MIPMYSIVKRMHSEEFEGRLGLKLSLYMTFPIRQNSRMEM